MSARPETWRALMRLLYPQRNTCHLCGRALAAADGCLCDRCLHALTALRIPAVDQLSVHPPLSVCVSAFWHEGVARELCHRLKYGGDPSAALPLAQHMAHALGRAGRAAWADVALPVPVHRSRLTERGYNQAELLAREVCAALCLPFCDDALSRVHHSHTQVGHSREERLLGMAGAFVAATEPIDGLRVLLIDDVLTTGATATACAQALLAAGAREVVLLTACRA